MTDEDVGRACTERLDYNNVLDISLQRKKNSNERHVVEMEQMKPP